MFYLLPQAPESLFVLRIHAFDYFDTTYTINTIKGGKMKRILLLVLCGSFLLAGEAQAGYNGPQKKRASWGPQNVAKAKTMADDTPLVLEGKIVNHLEDEKYTFRDRSGEITVEIDRELFHGKDVDPMTPVRIYGEVERKRNRVTIDVDSLELLPVTK